MLAAGVVVRVGCAKCSTVFDVDLKAVERTRGGHASLINARPACKVTRCRGEAYFLAAFDMDKPLQTLVEPDTNPLGLDGQLPCDLEPENPPPRPASAAKLRRAGMHQSASAFAPR